MCTKEDAVHLVDSKPGCGRDVAMSKVEEKLKQPGPLRGWGWLAVQEVPNVGDGLKMTSRWGKQVALAACACVPGAPGSVGASPELHGEEKTPRLQPRPDVLLMRNHRRLPDLPAAGTPHFPPGCRGGPPSAAGSSGAHTGNCALWALQKVLELLSFLFSLGDGSLRILHSPMRDNLGGCALFYFN